MEEGRERLLQHLLLPAELEQETAGEAGQHERRGGLRASRGALELPKDIDQMPVNFVDWAVKYGSLEQLRLLLAAGCPVHSWPGEPAPLHSAARRLDTERCRMLLAAGAPAAELWQGRHSALDCALALCTDPELVSVCSGEEVCWCSRLPHRACWPSCQHLGPSALPADCADFLSDSWRQCFHRAPAAGVD
jgi:hypothetical protein